MSTRHVCTKVTLRQRAIRNEKISLYLDYYPAIRNPETMTMSRREYLGIYIYANPNITTFLLIILLHIRIFIEYHAK